MAKESRDRAFAVNVTGILTLTDADSLDDPEVVAKVRAIEDAESFIAASE